VVPEFKVKGFKDSALALDEGESDDAEEEAKILAHFAKVKKQDTEKQDAEEQAILQHLQGMINAAE
jgi:hypothetical protein